MLSTVSQIVFMYSEVFLHIPEVEGTTAVIAVTGFSHIDAANVNS